MLSADTACKNSLMPLLAKIQSIIEPKNMLYELAVKGVYFLVIFFCIRLYVLKLMAASKSHIIPLLSVNVPPISVRSTMPINSMTIANHCLVTSFSP